MNTTRGGIGTLYKESFGFEDLDDNLRALGFGPVQILELRTDALEHGHSFFVIPTEEGITFASSNRVRLMMRGIDTEIMIDNEGVFETGDTVTLNSGGQIMTATKVNVEAKTVDLIWNNAGPDGFGTMSNVPFACLTPADPPA